MPSLDFWLTLTNTAARGFARRALRLDDVLIGPGATIDSLDLLNFLIQLERHFYKETGRFMPVVSESRLDRILSEAKTVAELVALLNKFAEE